MIRKLIVIAALLTCTPLVHAHAQYPDELPNDRRIRLLTYSESDIYTIQTKFGFQTHITFDPREEIVTISVGDRSGWQIVPSNARLFIRPLLRNIVTNMTVLTNKRAYQFEIKSAGEEKGGVGGNEEDAIFVAKFIYPEKEKLPAVSSTPYDVQSSYMGNGLSGPAPFAIAPTLPAANAPVRPPSHMGTATPQNPNYSYTFSGADELAPIQVFDNGTSTFIKYRSSSMPTPSIYLVDASGGETPLASRIDGEYVVVDTVAGELALKNSAGTVHVYNEVLNPK